MSVSNTLWRLRDPQFPDSWHRHGAWGRHRIVSHNALQTEVLASWWASKKLIASFRSDYSGSNTKLSKILLNGNNICMVILLDSDSINPDWQKILAHPRRRRSGGVNGVKNDMMSDLKSNVEVWSWMKRLQIRIIESHQTLHNSKFCRTYCWSTFGSRSFIRSNSWIDQCKLF